MCLIVTFVMLTLAIQSFIQQQWITGSIQLTIAFGFAILLIRNIIIVRNQKHGCDTKGCNMTEWFRTLFKTKEN